MVVSTTKTTVIIQQPLVIVNNELVPESYVKFMIQIYHLYLASF